MRPHETPSIDLADQLAVLVYQKLVIFRVKKYSILYLKCVAAVSAASNIVEGCASPKKMPLRGSTNADRTDRLRSAA
jgi:hypothetical protein